MRIGARLGWGFSSVLALLLCVAGLGIHGMTQSNDAIHKIVSEMDVEKALLTQMTDSTHITATVIRTAVLLTDENEIQNELKKIDAATRQYKDADSALKRFPLDEQEKNLLDQIDGYANAALPVDEQVIALAKQNRDDEAKQLLMSRAVETTNSWQDALRKLVKMQSDEAEQAEKNVEKSYQTAMQITMVLTLLAAAAGAFIAWRSTRSITRPIGNAVLIAQTVARGDLTSTIDTSGKDETGDLLRALKEMNDGLVSIVGHVREGASTIAAASQQIATGNLDLSSRTEEQASSLEEAAASMEELNSTVKHNSDNARQAHVMAEKASSLAVKGGTVVDNVVQTMGDINDSAKQIANIIGVIDGIAFQTNILALNAAVEAARAGEQGRGFAVVASEVRNLAQRSATAAKEIKGLIGSSVEKVETGSRLVHDAGIAMNEIVESVRHVSEIIGEITNATGEQTSGIQQITEAVAQMDQVTQQNAALVEEAAAAAASLSNQADGLAKAVSVFKLRQALAGGAETRYKELPANNSERYLEHRTA